jgi:hypothetical protein
MSGTDVVIMGPASMPAILLMLLSLYVVPRAMSDILQTSGAFRKGVYVVVLVLGALGLWVAVVPGGRPEVASFPTLEAAAAQNPRAEGGGQRR